MDTRIETLIESVEKQAREIYSFPNVFVSTDGSRSGILAAIASLPEGRILMARNCRKAAFDAVSLMRRKVGYLYPEELYLGSFIYGGISADHLKKILDNHREYCAVVLLSPTPEGIISDIEKIAEICHEHDTVLIVDESYGAHFPFYEDFPTSAIFLGADVVIHDLSKSLPAMEQSALVFVNTDAELTRKIKVALSTFVTEYPNEELVKSIQDCLDWSFRNENAFSDYLDMLLDFSSRFEQVPDLRLLDRDLIGTKDIFDMDEGRLVFLKDGLTGIALGNFLTEKQGIRTDGAGLCHVVIPTSVGMTRNDFRHLYKGLLATAGMPKYQPRKEYTQEQIALISLLQVVKTGKQYRDFIYVYPPGCPVIAPGETYTKAIKEQVTDLIDKGIEIEIWERYFS